MNYPVFGLAAQMPVQNLIVNIFERKRNRMTSIWKRSLSLFLAIVMVLGNVPFNALAVEEELVEEVLEEEVFEEVLEEEPVEEFEEVVEEEILEEVFEEEVVEEEIFEEEETEAPAEETEDVPVEETVRGFKEILEGKHDHIPEGFFLSAGTIDEVVARVQKQG